MSNLIKFCILNMYNVLYDNMFTPIKVTETFEPIHKDSKTKVKNARL